MTKLRDDARAIWQAGVDAVDSKRLVQNAISVDNETLTVAGEAFDLRSLRRIVVVGAGKAGAGMAEGVEAALGDDFFNPRSSTRGPQLTGYVNVPADCVRPLKHITLHAARPAGVNEPTVEGVAGTQSILDLVAGLSDDDLCIVLISGGGSALLTAPADPVTLDDKLQVTRSLVAAGATIQELNTVRKQLSAVKGGRLAEACRAGRMVTLVISDVIDDPLDLIASGPTVPDSTTPADAVAVLERYLKPDEIPNTVRQRLKAENGTQSPEVGGPNSENDSHQTASHHATVVIGSNSTAVAAAAAEARRRGYDVKEIGSANAGDAAEWGTTLAEAAMDARSRTSRPFCMIGGGETTVRLGEATSVGKGGRNQEIALAAVVRLWDERNERLMILSGGTDGEDGPTDAAGALADALVIAEARRKRLSPRAFLERHDSYAFFDATGGLLRTGPTHTNVMDLQVVIAEPRRKRVWVPSHEREPQVERPRRRTGRQDRRG